MSKLEQIEQRIRHITGECDCPPNARGCLYYKHCDEPRGWQTQLIMAEIKKLLK